jgi:hypothetical protein
MLCNEVNFSGEASVRTSRHSIRLDVHAHRQPVFNNDTQRAPMDAAPCYVRLVLRTCCPPMDAASCSASTATPMDPCLLPHARGPLHPRRPPLPAPPCRACSWNTCNIRPKQMKHLQHTFVTYATSKYNACNIGLKQLKHLKHTLATYMYSQCNICNIQIQYLQHRFETAKTFETYTSNINI